MSKEYLHGQLHYLTLLRRNCRVHGNTVDSRYELSKYRFNLFLFKQQQSFQLTNMLGTVLNETQFLFACRPVSPDTSTHNLIIFLHSVPVDLIGRIRLNIEIFLFGDHFLNSRDLCA